MGRISDALSKAAKSPFKALLPKNPWLRLAIFALPILVILALLEPVLSLFEKGFELFIRLLTPLLETSGGRLLLLNVILVLMVAVGFLILRSRIRSLRSGLVLRRHMDGIVHLVEDRRSAATECFRRVVRARAPAPDEYPQVQQDARLKLARLALESGDANRSLHWLTGIRESGLPKELKRSLAQLRVRTFLEQGEVLPETLDSEFATAQEQFGDDSEIARLRRRHLLQQGRLEEAAEQQLLVLKHSSGARELEERERAVEDLVTAGRELLGQSEWERARKLARRAAKLDAQAVEPGCLLGEILLAEGDLPGAVRAWGQTRSARGLELVGRLLDERPGAIPPRELIESCPLAGSVLLVAREYARQGDPRRAERAARTAARAVGITPSSALVLGEVLSHCGRMEDAERLSREAIQRIAAPSSAASDLPGESHAAEDPPPSRIETTREPD